MDAQDMTDELAQILITEEEIAARLDEMAAQIDADYKGEDLLLIGVLKGAVYVMADLSRRLHHDVQMDWMAVSSYGSGTKSSGVVRILKDLDTDLTGRHVLIVEDIIDSGLDGKFLNVCKEVAKDYPDIKVDDWYIDITQSSAFCPTC